MASNFSFGLGAISEVNEILVLLAQTIVLFSLYPIWTLEDTFRCSIDTFKKNELVSLTIEQSEQSTTQSLSFRIFSDLSLRFKQAYGL